MNLVAAGCAPRSVLPHICGASLHVCRKKSRGLRPIAYGEVLRHLTSKCLFSAARLVAFCSKILLLPLQLCMSVKGGFEVVIHSVSHLMSSVPPDQCWVLLLELDDIVHHYVTTTIVISFAGYAPNFNKRYFFGEKASFTSYYSYVHWCYIAASFCLILR